MTVENSGTQSASVGTEHTLGSAMTSSKTYVLTVNTENMVNSDELELRAYIKVLSGDSQWYLVYSANYLHDQGDSADAGSSAAGDVVKVSPPVVSPYSIKFTLKQVAGSSRDFDWNIVSL